MNEQEVARTVLEEAVRGFFFEKHLPGAEADAWTDEIVAIVDEHGWRWVPVKQTTAVLIEDGETVPEPVDRDHLAEQSVPRSALMQVGWTHCGRLVDLDDAGSQCSTAEPVFVVREAPDA